MSRSRTSRVAMIRTEPSGHTPSDTPRTSTNTQPRDEPGRRNRAAADWRSTDNSLEERLHVVPVAGMAVVRQRSPIDGCEQGRRRGKPVNDLTVVAVDDYNRAKRQRGQAAPDIRDGTGLSQLC
jgi:hypothetical protein